MSTTVQSELITLTINGQSVSVAPGTTIWQAAQQIGIDIPVLCHSPRMKPVGVCRMCVVDVGERTLAASCVRECQPKMNVQTSSEKVERQRRMLTQLLLSEYSQISRRENSTGDDQLLRLGRRYGLLDEENQPVDQNSYLASSSHSTPQRNVDMSSPVIAVDHQACILCDRCIRACDDIQSNNVIGRSGKGHDSKIAFDFDMPMGESTCVSCGECAAVCPTGALTDKQITLPVVPTEYALPTNKVDSVCPYCGVGCSITATVHNEKIIKVDGRESPVNHSRLCVKGRYGWDYVLHSQRLTRPLIRLNEHYPKTALSADVKESIATASGKTSGKKPGGLVNYNEVLPAFREATWDEALELVAEKLLDIKHQHGPGSLAGFGSAKCSNEEAYLFQKLIRAGFGTNNVDHCTRLCHASSVAALMETIGSGAVTNIFADVARSQVALVTGANATSNHPVAATFIKEAAVQGTKLIVVDVRRNPLADFATHFAQIKPGSDVAFYNAIMHVLIEEDLLDRDFILHRTEGFSELQQLVLTDYSPEQSAPICGIEPAEIRAIARTIGSTTSARPRNVTTEEKSGMLVFWGMGISQHTTGTDNARCLISICLMTGNVGKPGTGLHPLRGQNNVQGASDAGLIPMVYPDYQSVSDQKLQAKFEQAWGCELDSQPGLTVTEIVAGALDKTIRGMYIMGENPFLSDPNINKVRKALANLDFLVVQDIFLTETAEFADVILPAGSYFEKSGTYTNTDRRVQIGHKMIDPPGDARPDWEIICDIAEKMGLPMRYDSPADIFAEFTSLTTNYRGLNYDNLEATGKLWPCADPEHSDGAVVLFDEQFPTSNGRGKFVACPYLPADELPDIDFPLVLTTGRLLEHWHTGSMTRRSSALDALQPKPYVSINPVDLKRLGIASGKTVRVSSRRGSIQLECLADSTMDAGAVFIPFHFREAAANVLTTDVLDPYGKIPEFKYCAVKIEPVQQ